MTSRKGVPLDRKVPLVKPQTAASTRTVTSGRTRVSKVSEQPNQAQVLKTVTRRELASLVSDLERLRRENEFMLHQQETKFGATFDYADALRQELSKAKAINSSLLNEIAEGKEKCERLHNDFVMLQEKFEGCEKRLRQYRQEKKKWDNSRDKLRIAEDKCRRLVVKNKNLKYLLLKNGIKPEQAWKDVDVKADTKIRSKRNVTEIDDVKRKVQPKTMTWI